MEKGGKREKEQGRGEGLAILLDTGEEGREITNEANHPPLELYNPTLKLNGVLEH